MADFQRSPLRFICAGLSVNAAADALPPGKFARLQNLRSYIEGTLTPRLGQQALTSVSASAVHSINQLQDTTPFNDGIDELLIVGAGGTLFTGVLPANPLTEIDDGYSGDPLTLLPIQPVGTVQPWIYVADSAKQVKLNVNGDRFITGIVPPNVPPSADLAPPGLTVIDDMDYAGAAIPWTGIGTGSIPTPFGRVNTFISAILYDSGTTGNCLMALNDVQQLGVGMLLKIAGGAETTLVQDVKIAVVPTTIAAILYDDNAAPGLCTIQPTASLGTGQIQFPTPAQLRAYRGGVPPPAPLRQSFWKRFVAADQGIPPPLVDGSVPTGFGDLLSAPGQQIRQIDFPVDCLIVLDFGGANQEYVRVLSVAIGPDGLQSFRCLTTATHVAGETLTGISAVRCYLTGTRSVNDSVVTDGLINTLTPTVIDADTPMVGGITGAPAYPSPSTAPDPPGAGLDHTDVVAQAKADLEAQGVDLSGDCGAFNITQLVAQRLADEGAGLHIKTTGANCNGYAVAIIEYPDGSLYDILLDAGGTNGPQWNYTGGGGGTPPSPTFQPVGTVDLSTIDGRVTQPWDEFHLSVKIDQLSAVEEIRVYFDVDVPTATFTQNVFYVAFSSNDILAAVQASNAEAVTPLIQQQLGVVLPRTQVQDPSSLTPSAAQLSVGNNQWIELRWKVGQLIRIGTDPTRTLRDVRNIEILIQAASTMGNLIVSYDALTLTGGYGPDAGDVGVPNIYTYRYRSAQTGARSNVAPPMRAGVIPRRQRTLLTATPSTDPQVTKIDWFRFGSTLTKFTYVGTSENATPTFTDDYSDSQLDGGEPAVFDDFQPWPSHDLPKFGLCNTAGSAVQWISGDPFDKSWAPGSQILINGVPYTLFAQPTATDFLQLVENAGALTAATFEIPSATVLGLTNLPTLWGPLNGYYFAVGDFFNPGELRWTKAHDPDVTSDKNSLYVTSPATPLQNGFMWDGFCFVASTEDLYRIVEGNEVSQFLASLTPCGRGFWTRWAFCQTPQGIIFLAKDGIYVTTGGSAAQSLTDADLYPLFPHDGVQGAPVGSIEPPDMSATTSLRLSYANGYVYFDYLSTLGNLRTLVLDIKAARWFYDLATPGVTMRVWSQGAGISSLLLGCPNGEIRQQGGTSDAGEPIAWAAQIPIFDGGEPRANKQFGDLVLKADLQGSTGGVTVTPGYNDFTTSLSAHVVGPGDSGIQSYIVDLRGGAGLYARNLGIQIAGSDTLAAPIFYLWEPSWILKAPTTALRATDWDDAGYFGAKFVQGCVIECDTGGAMRTVVVQGDGGGTVATFTVQTTSTDAGAQVGIPVSFITPFIAHTMRLLPTDAENWDLFRVRWVWEPTPELVASWITQPTTLDWPGYSQLERALVGYISTVDAELTISFDGGPAGAPVDQVYTLVSSEGAYVKPEVLFRPNKGKVYTFAVRTIDGTNGIRIFQRDLEIRARYWGSPDPYQPLKPFGDASRANGGARI